MAFSKITSVEVTNFMVYSRAKLVFDESNIVNIKGYNSAGKSTMLKALAVCLTNMFPKSQTKLIRHGEEYFRIVVNFSDGISILRDKYANGQSLYEMYKNGVCVFTTKEGRKLSKVDDVPEVIKAYLGLCSTSFGCLNYQSRQDKLWLVETTGSENYSTLNEILKSEEISRANALINSDKNRLSAEITEIESSLQAVKMERMSAEAYSEDLLKALEERQAYVKDLDRRVRDIRRLASISKDIRTIVVPPVVSPVDCDRLSKTSMLGSLLKDISEIKVYPVISTIGVERLQCASTLMAMFKEVQDGKRKIVATEIPVISLNRFKSLDSVVLSAKSYVESSSSYKKIVSATAELQTRLDRAVAEAESQGVHFVKCINCGSYTEVTEEVDG